VFFAGIATLLVVETNSYFQEYVCFYQYGLSAQPEETEALMFGFFDIIDGPYTEWSRGNECFSYKNNFVYFQHKKVLITQKRRQFNSI